MATAQEFTISATIWADLAPLRPAHVAKAHPLGCHRPHIPDQDAPDADVGLAPPEINSLNRLRMGC